MITFRLRYRVGRDIEQTALRARCAPKQGQAACDISAPALSDKGKPPVRRGRGFLRRPREVQFPPDMRSGQQQLARIRAVDVVVLADRPFHQQSQLHRIPVPPSPLPSGFIELPCIRFILHQAGERMVRNPAAGRRRRPHLDCTHPARLGDGHFGQRLKPDVLAVGRHGVGIRLDRPYPAARTVCQLPAVVVRPLFGRRHVFGISQRGARVHPARRWSRSARRSATCRSETAESQLSCRDATAACFCVTTRCLMDLAQGRVSS